MALYLLLVDHRTQILARCHRKVSDALGPYSSGYSIEVGIPELYEEMIEVLRISLECDSAETREKLVKETVKAGASCRHAQDSYRQGFTVSQLVHGYGCICQGITEYASEIDAQITSAEFAQLNLCLDVAIAHAVSEYERLKIETSGKEESLRLGFLAHELRNYLSGAILAHELMRSGSVAPAGATSEVLSKSLNGMKEIIDRAVAELSVKGIIKPNLSRIQIRNLLEEIRSSLNPVAQDRLLDMTVESDPTLEVSGDRHLLSSAISNLVQNAIKYTQPGTHVWIRAFAENGSIVIEVEDRCGGLPHGMTSELFMPYKQGNSEGGGMGLGLSIAQRAVQLNGGTISAMDWPGIGCTFSIRLPIQEDPNLIAEQTSRFASQLLENPARAV